MNPQNPTSVSIVIPTYKREQVLIDTIEHLALQKIAPTEILIVDQTPKHTSLISQKLSQYEKIGKIRWIRLPKPSIPYAMNIGLKLSRYKIVLFLDDDIIPNNNLIDAHIKAHSNKRHNIVAGRVIQVNKAISENNQKSAFAFSSKRQQFVSEVMGGNFSVKRELAIDLGGFDENFIDVAYRFEAEFCERVLKSGEKIFYEPAASIGHLKTYSGGTRSFGHHLTTLKHSHSVGAYYYLLRSKMNHNRLFKIFGRPLRAIKSRFHLKHPWWIPVTLISELKGLFLAVKLKSNGPKYID